MIAARTTEDWLASFENSMLLVHFALGAGGGQYVRTKNMIQRALKAIAVSPENHVRA